MDIQSMVLESSTTPAALAAREEYSAIMTDTKHPMHAGYLAGNKQVNDHIDGLYAKLAQTAPPAKTESLVLVDDMSGDGEAQVEIEIALRNELGSDYDDTMANMKRGASHVFAGDEGQAALTVLSHRISELGPQAEVLGVRFLSEIAKFKH